MNAHQRVALLWAQRISARLRLRLAPASVLMLVTSLIVFAVVPVLVGGLALGDAADAQHWHLPLPAISGLIGLIGLAVVLLPGVRKALASPPQDAPPREWFTIAWVIPTAVEALLVSVALTGVIFGSHAEPTEALASTAILVAAWFGRLTVMSQLAAGRGGREHIATVVLAFVPSVLGVVSDDRILLPTLAVTLLASVTMFTRSWSQLPLPARP